MAAATIRGGAADDSWPRRRSAAEQRTIRGRGDDPRRRRSPLPRPGRARAAGLELARHDGDGGQRGGPEDARDERSKGEARRRDFFRDVRQEPLLSGQRRRRRVAAPAPALPQQRRDGRLRVRVHGVRRVRVRHGLRARRAKRRRCDARRCWSPSWVCLAKRCRCCHSVRASTLLTSFWRRTRLPYFALCGVCSSKELQAEPPGAAAWRVAR